MTAARRTRRIARELFRECVVDGELDAARLRAVARRVADSGRRGRLAVLSALQRRVRVERDRHAAVVAAAVALPEDVREVIRSALARRYGPGLEVSFVQVPALVGGLRITVGSAVYDGSVQARLAAIAAGLGIAAAPPRRG